ncbi:hypothetical protein JHK87_009866 [Glycine soja]|nr:hypothetical protein JHK87_009866 [Glycine soja]
MPSPSFSIPTDSLTTSSADSSMLLATVMTLGVQFTSSTKLIPLQEEDAFSPTQCHIGILVRANHVNIAKAIYDQVLTEAILESDVYTYTTMIRGFCKVGKVENACKVFDRLVESQSCKPDVVSFTTLIDGYSKRGGFREALECLKEMVKRGCLLNVVTYNALIECLCLSSEVDEARKMMSRMCLNGLKDIPTPT